MEKKYKPDEESEFLFLGKGGYSRVYRKKGTNQVEKMIKARKLKSKTSLNSIRNEIMQGTFY